MSYPSRSLERRVNSISADFDVAKSYRAVIDNPPIRGGGRERPRIWPILRDSRSHPDGQPSAPQGRIDHSHPWITHVSWQRCDLHRTAECVVDLRAQYGKPVIVDEAGYEGNINWGWGNLTAEEEVRRFWEGCLRGGYVTHVETFVDRGPKLWWAHGGKLYGDSPERIAFCRSYMESLPSGMDWVPDEIGVIDGTFTWDVTCMADSMGKGTDDVLMYFGFFRPAYREFTGDEGKRYQVDVIDTWNMTVETLPQTFEGAFRIDLPSRQYMMLRVRTVKAE